MFWHKAGIAVESFETNRVEKNWEKIGFQVYGSTRQEQVVRNIFWLGLLSCCATNVIRRSTARGLTRLAECAFSKRILEDEVPQLFWDRRKKWAFCLCNDRFVLDVPGKWFGASFQGALGVSLADRDVTVAVANMSWLLILVNTVGYNMTFGVSLRFARAVLLAVFEVLAPEWYRCCSRRGGNDGQST